MHLVDSHVLLWLVSDDSRLGVTARTALSRSEGVHVSSISVLELTIKQMIGKLDLPEDFESRLAGQGMRLLPLDAVHVSHVQSFPELVRHDPFDRALLAQAQAENLRFVTADRRLLDLGLTWVDDATL